MKAIIEPGSIAGNLMAPPSKSMAQRAYAAALLHKGRTIIHNAGQSGDEAAALRIIQQLGARVISRTDAAEGQAHVISRMEIESNGIYPNTNRIDCGESGLAARLFTPIAGLCSGAISIAGSGSLLRRPMTGVMESLAPLNVALTGFGGYLPFTVQGPLQAKPLTVNAADGSQLLSGLLFALCHSAAQPVTVEVNGLKSRPYIDMTLEVLAHFGRPVTHTNYRRFYIDPALFTEQEVIETVIEADWSSAAYLLVAGAIAGAVTIRNLNAASKQADTAIMGVLKDAGAEIAVENGCISVHRAALRAFEFDATHSPDLFPVLAILAACCEGESYIAGVHRLFDKESNRVESITEMLGDFNVPFSVEDDTLCISGVYQLQGTVIDAYKDHRIAMAAATGALRASGPVEISDAESVNKSYPGFFSDLSLSGGKCILV